MKLGTELKCYVCGKVFVPSIEIIKRINRGDTKKRACSKKCRNTKKKSVK